MLPLKYGNDKCELRVIGKGVPYYYSPLKDLIGSFYLSRDNCYYHPGKKIDISQENFVIGPIVTFTTATRLFFMKNLDKEHSIAFSFTE